MVDEATRYSLKRQAHGFLVAVTAVLAVLAKRASRLPQKLKAEVATARENWTRIELRSPKKLLKFTKKKKNKEEKWGDGGVWQKEILMGDKCEPLDFSGVISYDSHGKQVNELPLRSPRATHVPGYFG